ncbi:MAG: hypothetical protein JXR91_09290 [Deltaproteobacteria bacterium]|nr:hypothetical protein [Deltaproteobacteria bacterium]
MLGETKPAEYIEALVSYISWDRIYLSAGSFEGINVEDEFTIERNNKDIATVRILNVSGDSSSAVILDKKGMLNVDDAVRIPLKSIVSTPLPVKEKRDSVPADSFNDSDLGVIWTRTLIDTPPKKVIYSGHDDNDAVNTFLTSNAATRYNLYSYFSGSSYFQSEHSFSFYTSADNFLVEGLTLTIDGNSVARYDDNYDYYLSGRKTYSLLRTLSLNYNFKSQPVSVTFGRFMPHAPVVHTIDGMAVTIEDKKFSISVFGGLQPDDLDLTFNPGRQTFGIASRVTPGNRNIYTIETAVMSQLYEKKFYRAALGLNNRLDFSGGFHLMETAVMDILSADDQNSSKGDFSLTRLGVDANWPVSGRVGMDFSAMYRDQVSFVEDYNTIPEAWIASLNGRSLSRVEIGAPVTTKKGNSVRPFIFGRGDFENGGFDTGVGGAGVTIRDDSFFKSNTSITSTFDYGIGIGQIANIDVSLQTPLRKDKLYILSGLLSTWNHVYNSDVNTLRHLAFMMLRGHLKRFNLTANWQTGYDHALVRLTYPFGVWMQFQLGVEAFF